MFTSSKLKLTAAILLAAVALAALVLSVQTFVLSGPGNANIRSGVEADLAILSEPARGSDALSVHVASIAADIGDGGLKRETVRKLGDGATATYCTGLDAAENVCIVFELRSATTGYSCGPSDMFNAEGIAVALENMETSEYLEARLLPDRAVPSNTESYVIEAPGVIAISPSLRGEGNARIEVPVRSGDPISFRVLGEVPRDQL